MLFAGYSQATGGMELVASSISHKFSSTIREVFSGISST